MKKLFLVLGLASLMMVACHNTTKEPEQTQNPTPEQTEQEVEKKEECPMHALKDEYAKWDEMNDEAKKELNKKASEVFAEMDKKMEEMKAAGQDACKDMAEMSEEAKQECEKKCAEMKAKWDNFANMTVDEQKDLIMERLNGCNHDGEKACCNKEAEAPAENPTK